MIQNRKTFKEQFTVTWKIRKFKKNYTYDKKYGLREWISNLKYEKYDTIIKNSWPTLFCIKNKIIKNV